jgi:hypothetical protein
MSDDPKSDTTPGPGTPVAAPTAKATPPAGIGGSGPTDRPATTDAAPAAKPGAETSKPGSDASKPGAPAVKPPAEPAKPSVPTTRPADPAAKAGAAGAKAPGTETKSVETKGTAEPPRPTAAPAKAPAKAAGGRGVPGWLWLIAIVALLIAAGYLTRPLWSQPLGAYVRGLFPAPAEDARVAGLDQRLATVEKALADRRADAPASDAVRTLQGEAADTRGELKALNERLAAAEAVVAALRDAPPLPSAGGGDTVGDAVEARLRRLEAAARPEAIRDVERRLGELSAAVSGLAAVEGRLASVEAAAQTAGRASAATAATVLALDRLAEAVTAQRPFTGELADLRRAAGDDAELAAAADALAPHAGGGVPTFAQLFARFPDVARVASQADTARAGDRWLDRAVNEVTSLVTVRRMGEAAVADGGTDAALALTERTLLDGDLRSAVGALRTLPAPAADRPEVVAWIADAEARLVADEALSRLRLRTIAHLAERKG